jgi:allantoinase
VLKAAEFAYSTSCAVHFCHLSLARSVELVSWFVSDGLDATVETCPHYLTFDDSSMDELGSRLKINPPLRGVQDQAALWAAIAAGRIDVVASDHAPWPLEQKKQPNVFDNHSGVPGVETLVPLVLGQGLARGIAVDALARVLSTNPAKRFGLASKGEIAVGKDADLIVFDPAVESLIDETKLHSNAAWSPYHGRRVHGRLTHVVARGDLVVDGELSSRPGRGKVLTPEAVK